MNEYQYQEIIAMLTVIYKKLDNLEQKVKGSSRLASTQIYVNELRREAQKIIDQIEI